LEVEHLLERLEKGSCEEHALKDVELKSNWEQRHGKDISALANGGTEPTAWLVVGADDKGRVKPKEENWARSTELTVSNHINQFLEPTWTVEQVSTAIVQGSDVVLVRIKSPGSVVRWNGKAYKKVGTTSPEMRDHEILELSLKLPGADYSKEPYDGDFDASLVFDFAKHLKRNDIFTYDEKSCSAQDILIQLGVAGTNTVRILFGECGFRIAFFDNDERIVENRARTGLFYLLSDHFIEEVTTWTRKQGLTIGETSVFAHSEQPYPIEAIRECVANAVAHALYSRADGEILVEVHPNRFCVRNNCGMDAQLFVNKWYSRISRPNNRHLMAFLRNARITDELGTGKIRLLRSMLELGKRAPLVELQNAGSHGRWSVYLYPEIVNQNTESLIAELKSRFPSSEEWRLALALIHWSTRPWTEILGYLDEYYRQIANKILSSRESPLLRTEDSLFLKRWAFQPESDSSSRPFSKTEKEKLLKLFQEVSISNQGRISNSEARSIVGFGDSQSEAVQLSRLFRQWQEVGLVKQSRRGEWQFALSQGSKPSSNGTPSAEAGEKES
jgi:predicted HTH transcriptional regulator